MKVALITGITGQDGYYLTKLLIEKDYIVHGLIRRSSQFNTNRIDGLISEYSKKGILNLHYSDMTDPSSVSNLINIIKPDEIYHLAAQSHVAVSFNNPLYTSNVSSIGTVTILETIKNSNKKIKFYNASSSEMYGGSTKESFNENSQFNPKSPYASAKVHSHHLTKIYRESYGLFAVNGILFNHESPHRGETFVTRKISRAAGRINQGLQSKLTLGNLDAERDWGYAGDYVYGMYLMMQHESPEDWVLSTGKSYSVKQFCEYAFSFYNLDWTNYVQTDEKYYRPNEVKYLLGDSSKAFKYLNWTPKTTFKELVEIMVDSDNKLAKQEKILLENGLIKPTWENFKS